MTSDELKLNVKGVGKDGFIEIRDKISKFVEDNFDILYVGAVRLNKFIERDYFAPRRIQINNTRLHECQGLKYADGHKYNSCFSPTEEQLRNTVKDIQMLLDVAGEDIPAPFELKIIENS